MPRLACLLLGASLVLAPGAGHVVWSAGQLPASAYEPPAMRDVDDEIVDLMQVESGETRHIGDFMSACGKPDTVIVVRHTEVPGSGDRIECLRSSDKCLAIMHADGSAELWRVRKIECALPDGSADSAQDDVGPGILRRRFVRGSDCFEDLRVISGAPTK